VNEINSV